MITTLQVLDTLQILKQTGNRDFYASILKAEIKIQGERRLEKSLRLLDEAASLLPAMRNPKELEERLDNQINGLFKERNGRDWILGQLRQHMLPERLYGSVLMAFAEYIRIGSRAKEIPHSWRLGTEYELEIFVECIARGISKDATWLETIRGPEACSLKRLGKQIQGLKLEPPSPIPWELAQDLTQEDSVGSRFMAFFEVDLKAHERKVGETRKILKAVKAGWAKHNNMEFH